jgi:hypothetical protein
MRQARALAVFICFFALLLIATANDKRPKSYPESGTVISSRLAKQSGTVTIYNEPYGKTRRENSIQVHVYRVETEGRWYELQGAIKPTLSVGDSVHFRINKDAAYVQRGDKEDKYWILRAAQKSRSDRPSPSSDPLSLR